MYVGVVEESMDIRGSRGASHRSVKRLVKG
jgi:hypothetical protein